MTVDSVGDSGEDIDVIFSGGGEVAADAGKVMSAFESAEPPRDFLLDFQHAQVLFGTVVGEGNRGVGKERKDVVGMIFEPIQKVLSFGFGNATPADHARGRQRRILKPTLGNSIEVAFAPSAELSGGHRRTANPAAFNSAMHGQQDQEHFPGPNLPLLLEEESQFAQEMSVA